VASKSDTLKETPERPLQDMSGSVTRHARLPSEKVYADVVRILLYGAVIYLLLGIRIVKPDQWLVVMRSGKYRGFRKQGVHWVLPFVDETVRVDLAEVTASWKDTPEEVLETAVHKWITARSPS
jgi:hypothetical protein